MPNYNVKPPRPYKKGQSGNPRGSSAKSRALGKIKAMTADKLARVGTMLLEGNMEQMRELAKDEESPVIEVWMAALIVKSMAKGDAGVFRALTDRIVGTVKSQVELTGRDGEALQLDMKKIDMSEEEKIERAEALAKLRREIGRD